MKRKIETIQICPICGSAFVPTALWVYKITRPKVVNYYCRYKCYVKAGGDGGVNHIYKADYAIDKGVGERK